MNTTGGFQDYFTSATPACMHGITYMHITNIDRHMSKFRPNYPMLAIDGLLFKVV